MNVVIQLPHNMATEVLIRADTSKPLGVTVVEQIEGQFKGKQISALEWHKYPDDIPTAQLVLVAHNNAITTVFGNGLKNFIQVRPYIYWADIPKLPE